MVNVAPETIAAGIFGGIFVVALLVLAIKYPKPTQFQYTVFRIVLATAVAGIAPFIPGLLEVNINGSIKAGGALGVFVIVYFFSPADLVLSKGQIDLPLIVKVWDGIRAPDVHNIDMDMAHKALNALKVVASYWNRATNEEKRLIKDESFTPFEQWFTVLDSLNIKMSDGLDSRTHLNGTLRKAFKEMNSYV